VSCIVPVFNGERFVSEAVESILAQTHRPLEVVVVDDGSTDRTPAVLAEFGDRIRTFRQENAGPSAARNLGLEESRGEYVAFLDADDLWVDDKIEAQLTVLRGDPELDLCSGHIRSFWIPELDEERRELEDEPYHREKPMLSPCTLLTTRATFERIGGFDPALRAREDSDWFIRAQRAGVRIETLPRLVTHRRQHTENLTRRSPPSRDALLDLIQRTVDPESTS
jgi:glycosyltransferase involved in cell wall biosynthesis